MMKINCELPNTMLDHNNELNEYDFVLFHLYKSNSTYREYYKQQRVLHPDRLMILDNSAYEFYVKGEELDLEEYKNTIIDLQPDLYILPDVLMDHNKTLGLVDKFLTDYEFDIITDTNNKSQPLAVAQGNTSKELVHCLLEYYCMNIENVAIPFHNSFFIEMGEQSFINYSDTFLEVYKGNAINKDHKYALGRIMFMNNNRDLLNNFKHVHLLGSHCPLEKIFYDKIGDTMDTGYPVKCGIVGYKLFEEPEKPDIIIDEFMDTDIDNITKNLIINNIESFRYL